MKKLALIAAAFGVVVHSFAATPLAAPVRKPKALLIMLDGARADALAAARMPAVESLCDGSWAPGYSGAWSFTGQTVPDARPSSAANHTAILTAVNAEKSRVFENGQTKDGDYARWPTWLARVTETIPGTRGLFIFAWGEGNQYPRSPNVRFIHDSDVNNGRRIGELLSAPDAPDAIQYFINHPDDAGHGTGFYPFGAHYLPALETIDTYIASALAAIKGRPTFDEEDWLIGVTADHGGYGREHGMWGGQASTIPLVVSGRHIPSGRLVGAPRNYDLTATALAHFGIDPVALGLDGRPLTAAASLAPCALGDGLVTGDGGKPVFENGGDFAAALWARLPAKQTGDPVLFSNKDWTDGANPGVALVAAKRTDGVAVPGVCFNAGRPDRGRIDIGTFDVEPGQWTFYAVTRNSEGVLTVYQGRSDGILNWCSAYAPDIIVESGLPFRVGQDGTGTYPHRLDGDVKGFSLWTRGLSHEEVRRVFEAGRDGLMSNGPADVPKNVKIAAANSSAADKADADLVCTGKNDERMFNTAISRLKRGGTLKMADGDYFFDAFGEEGDTAVIFGFNDGIARTITIEGTTENKSYNTRFGVAIHVTETAVKAAHGGGRKFVFKGTARRPASKGDFFTMTHVNNVNFSNFYILFHDASAPICGISGSGFGSMFISLVGIYTERYFDDRFLHRKPATPVEGSVGVISLHESNDEMARVGYEFVNVGGLHTGFLFDGVDHLVMKDCSAARCCYGYATRNRGSKTLTMINCCDEGNSYLPRFGGSGHLTAIDFNIERFNAAYIPDCPGGTIDHRASEETPGAWHGFISYTLQGEAFGIQNFWANGAGMNFRTVNLDHSLTERPQHPEYLETYFDRKTGQTLTWNGEMWLNAFGVPK